MRATIIFSLGLAAAAICTSVMAEIGHDGCCAHCGASAACQKVCRLVCEDRKVEVTCFGCLCEPFCVPCPSCPSCQHCECVCESCDTKGDGKTPYAKAKPFVWSEWIPAVRAKIYTKKKLMKKTETVTVKSYKWVVEDLCPNCNAAVASVEIAPGADVPPAPVVLAKFKPGQLQLK